MLVIDSWAGRLYYKVTVIGKTPKKYRVQIQSPRGVDLPGGRHVKFGETVLVPQHAVKEVEA